MLLAVSLKKLRRRDIVIQHDLSAFGVQKDVGRLGVDGVVEDHQCLGRINGRETREGGTEEGDLWLNAVREDLGGIPPGSKEVLEAQGVVRNGIAELKPSNKLVNGAKRTHGIE
jgi:hypothetical protein